MKTKSTVIGHIHTHRIGKKTLVRLYSYSYISGTKSECLYVKPKDRDRVILCDEYYGEHDSMQQIYVPIDVEAYVTSLEEINCAGRSEVLGTIVFIQNGVTNEVFYDGVVSHYGCTDVVEAYNAEIKKISAKYVPYY